MSSQWSRRAALGSAATLVLLASACGRGGPGTEARASVSAPVATSEASPLSPTTPPPTPIQLPPTPTPTPTCHGVPAPATWSLQRLAWETVAVPVDEGNVAAVSAAVASGAGGVLLLGSQAPSTLGASLAALARGAPDGVAPLVMTDEEGGAIQRMANLVGSMPSARQMAATMSATQIQQLATQVGQRMRASGVTVDLAPVLDLDGGDGPSDTDPDGTRSFSTDASLAAADGLAFAAGLRAAGVVPVVKHFPGLGGASANPDSNAATTEPWSALQSSGLLPFQSAVRAGLPAVMVADAAVPGLTTLPATLSPAVVTDVLRHRLGFTGLVMTDSLSATSISAAGYSVGQAAVAALAAGADMLILAGRADAMPAVANQAIPAIVGAVQSGHLARAVLEAAVGRILALEHVTVCR